MYISHSEKGGWPRVGGEIKTEANRPSKLQTISNTQELWSQKEKTGEENIFGKYFLNVFKTTTYNQEAHLRKDEYEETT